MPFEAQGQHSLVFVGSESFCIYLQNRYGVLLLQQPLSCPGIGRLWNLDYSSGILSVVKLQGLNMTLLITYSSSCFWSGHEKNRGLHGKPPPPRLRRRYEFFFVIEYIIFNRAQGTRLVLGGKVNTG